jgi:hypothetical protein
VNLKEYVKQRHSPDEIWDYLFDTSEWYYFMDPQNNTPQSVIDNGSHHCLALFVGKEEVKAYAEHRKSGDLIVMRPRPGLKRLCELLDQYQLDGAMIDNFYYVAKDSIISAYRITYLSIIKRCSIISILCTSLK